MNFKEIDKIVDQQIVEAKNIVDKSINMSPKLWIWFYNQYGISFINSYE